MDKFRDTYNEEYITENADSFNWDDFECSMNIFSKKFVKEFKSEIKILFWKNEEGLLHREDGPATIDKRYNQKTWYIDGEEISKNTKKFLSKAKKQKFKNSEEKEVWYLENMHKLKYKDEKFPLLRNFSKDFFVKAKETLELGEMFMWSAEQGYNTLVKILVEILGVDYREYVGSTAFMMAASSDQRKTVDLLLELGADINAVDDHDRNAVMFCDFFYKEEMANFIREHKDYVQPEIEKKLVVAKTN